MEICIYYSSYRSNVRSISVVLLLCIGIMRVQYKWYGYYTIDQKFILYFTHPSDGGALGEYRCRLAIICIPRFHFNCSVFFCCFYLPIFCLGLPRLHSLSGCLSLFASYRIHSIFFRTYMLAYRILFIHAGGVVEQFVPLWQLFVSASIYHGMLCNKSFLQWTRAFISIDITLVALQIVLVCYGGIFFG